MTPNERHLLAFGRVIHNFAAVESGIKIALSGILEVRLCYAMVILEPYSAANLKKVARSLAKMRLKPELSEQFCWIVGEWAKHSNLRNNIAHSRWTKGNRPGAIKPQAVRVTDKSAKWLGIDDDEADYTTDDLEKAAHSLHETNERMKRFLDDSNLRQIVEEKLENK